jgi:hypothetical protein
MIFFQASTFPLWKSSFVTGMEYMGVMRFPAADGAGAAAGAGAAVGAGAAGAAAARAAAEVFRAVGFGAFAARAGSRTSSARRDGFRHT